MSEQELNLEKKIIFQDGHLIVLTFLKKKFGTEKLDNSTKPKGTFFSFQVIIRMPNFLLKKNPANVPADVINISML